MPESDFFGEVFARRGLRRMGDWEVGHLPSFFIVFASILSWFRSTTESSMRFCDVISLFEKFLRSSVFK